MRDALGMRYGPRHGGFDLLGDSLRRRRLMFTSSE